ncbi:MAG TPA: YidB family protein [Terriglobales bacterium]|nr:YidB family protein [Terriglobales bacterium]
MGFLDNLESQAVTSLLGNSSNPLATNILQMIQNQPGGLQGLVQSFHDKGLGGVVSSWVSTGQNLPISADQIHQVLGSDTVKQLAASAGISPDLAGSSVAQLLPTIVDKLTPNGEVGDHSSVMDMVGGLLQSFTQAKAS